LIFESQFYANHGMLFGITFAIDLKLPSSLFVHLQNQLCAYMEETILEPKFVPKMTPLTLNMPSSLGITFTHGIQMAHSLVCRNLHSNANKKINENLTNLIIVNRH